MVSAPRKQRLSQSATAASRPLPHLLPKRHEAAALSANPHRRTAVLEAGPRVHRNLSLSARESSCRPPTRERDWHISQRRPGLGFVGGYVVLAPNKKWLTERFSR